jgi:predicted nucleic acid-binding protein
MSGKFFLDTNIFVYSFDGTSSKKAQRAGPLIRQAIQPETEL